MKKSIFTSLTLALSCLVLTTYAFTGAPPSPNSVDCNQQFIFASSNTSGMVGFLDVADNRAVMVDSFMSTAGDADGVFYNPETDKLYQVNRSANVVNEYSNVAATFGTTNTPMLTATSSSDFTNGRGIAVFDDKIIVADDVDGANKLVVYTIGMGSITLDKTFDVSINLWGLHLSGSTLYAIVDNSNQVAIFNDIFANSGGSLAPDMTVTVDNLVRTHGITYVSEEDYMILTDIGDAASNNDGALVAISNFTSAAMDGTITSAEQVRVSGGASLMGNPVDVAYNFNDGRVYVAERARRGGLILGFNMPVLSGGIGPAYVQSFPGASSIAFSCNADFDPCEFIDGGTVAFENGESRVTIIVDGNPDEISFDSTVNNQISGYNFTYVVTDANDTILGIPGGDMVDFNGAGLGACRVWGLSYSGNLNISMGSHLTEMDLEISDECFELSSNFIVVDRVAPQTPEVRIFASSNTSGQVGVINALPDGNRTMDMFASQGMDADGIYYDQPNDILYQLNRTNNRVDVFTAVVTGLDNGNGPMTASSSTSNFSNGREIAVSGNKLVVAQDGPSNRLIVYNITPSTGAISFDRTFDVSFNLWGIHLDGSTLYAIKDNSNELAVFYNFTNNPSGSISEDRSIAIENLVRTHGITYNPDEDYMLLTDIGDAGSASDGFIVAIPNFSDKIDDNMISADEQIRVGGGTSMLGNPVDIAFDATQRRIYVAERARNGGMILAYRMPIFTGGIAPIYSKSFAGASAVNIFGPQGEPCNGVDAGTLSLTSGGVETTIIVDADPDLVFFDSTLQTNSTGINYAYIVTDASNNVLAFPMGDFADLNGAGVGVCRVYGVAYTGNLTVMMGDDITMLSMLSDDCFDLSDNYLTVRRINPTTSQGILFASSNTSGSVGVFDILGEQNATERSFSAQGMDADGIFYDAANDYLYQVNRTNNVIDVYSNVLTNLANGMAPTYVTSSSSDFTNGREITMIDGNKLVVAQDAEPANLDENRLVVYDISTPGTITLFDSYLVGINLWGIEGVGSDLYAIVDNGSQVAFFEDLSSTTTNSAIQSMTINIENMVRTHGLTYDAANDYMILTDIGSAGSAGDGALVAVPNFKDVSFDSFIGANEQIRVSGGASQLGNPVDVTYDSGTELLYVAERARGGGKILGFRMPDLSGGIAPVYVKEFPGASAVFLTSPTANRSAGTSTTPAAKDIENVTLAQVFPVPATTTINAVVESASTMNATINIYAINGVLLQSQQIAIEEGENFYQIDISRVPVGQLLFEIPEAQKVIPFVKASN